MFQNLFRSWRFLPTSKRYRGEIAEGNLNHVAAVFSWKVLPFPSMGRS
jgi:hypothetical protein